jgi:guanyl-specific ribonuclease Sa
MPAVPAEAKELARDMVDHPDRFNAFGNDQKILPKPQKGGSFIEGTVALGQAQGTGQYRVVCELDTKGKVVRKYWSASHYGTGSDASKKPAFVEFQ